MNKGSIVKSPVRTSVTFLLLLLPTWTIYGGQISLPTTLDKLLPDGDFAVVDGLTFSDFDYVSGGSMPIAAQINVEAAVGGLRYTGPFLDLPGGDTSTATLNYLVSGGSIGEATLSGNPSLLGGAGTGTAKVTESFAGDPGTLEILDGMIPMLTSSTSITPTSSLTVSTDILLHTIDPIQAATLSVVEQTFTIVPEPGSETLLLLVGFLGAGLLRRRSR